METVFGTVMSSPMMRPLYLERLGASIQSFVTSSQVVPTLQLISQVVFEGCEETLGHQDSLGPQLKARKKSPTSDVSQDMIFVSQASAVAMSITCRIAGVVLVSLSEENLPAEARRQFDDALRELSDRLSTVLTKSMKFLNKWIKVSPKDLWGSAVATSALLRFSYTLGQRYGSLALPDLQKRLLAFVDEDSGRAACPELTFEVVSHSRPIASFC